VNTAPRAIHHLNCGTLCPHGARLITGEGSLLGVARMVCHCILIEGAEGLVLIADVDGAPAAAISFADGEPVGTRSDTTLLSILRAYRWAIRGFAAVWAA